MNSPTLTANFKKMEPVLADALDLLRKDIFLNLNCHAIGTIQSFDKDKQTVSATINYKKTYLQPDLNGVYQTVSQEYPVLLDMPAIVISGGLARLSFPIQAGDTCLILFNDRDIDNWFKSGQILPVASGRLHSFSDGIALVGLRSSANPHQNYDDTRAVLSWGNTMVGVGASKVKVANTEHTLNDVLQELSTDLQNLVVNIQTLVTATSAITVICAAPTNPSSVPVNAAAILAVNTQLTTTANQLTATAAKIGELLE